MKYLILLLAVATLSACNETSGGAEATSVPAEIAPPANGIVDPGTQDPAAIVADPGSTTQTVTVTYYSKTRTIAPSQSNPTFTFDATASCFEYQSRQFCWDDGLHSAHTSYEDNYFGLQVSLATGDAQSCKISCNSSYMESVREVTNRRSLTLIVLGGTMGQEVDSILATGTPSQTSCTDDGTTLTCGNIVVSL